MNGTFIARILVGVLAFGLSLAVAPQDMPETPYDESQELPFEDIPLLPIEMQRATLEETQALVKADSPFRWSSLRFYEEIFAETQEQPEPVNADSLGRFVPPLRC